MQRVKVTPTSMNIKMTLLEIVSCIQGNFFQGNIPREKPLET